MKLHIRISSLTRRASRCAAFTLIEIMIVIALMTVIILGLMAMFNQVQRAFRAGMTQVDVLESGRMAMNLISRELQEITPGYRDATNFIAQIPFDEPLPLPLPAMSPLSPDWRTNVLEEMFFLTRENQHWVAIGYKIDPTAEGIGSLYRWERRLPISQDPGRLFYLFQASVPNRGPDPFSRILDGVVQFRVRTYDTNGAWIVKDIGTNALDTRIFASVSPPDLSGSGQVMTAPGEIGFYLFTSNAVPASVELELGVLEQQAWEKYKSLPVVNVTCTKTRSDYLQKQGGRVHLFRQRIAIRNVDSSAYPP